ncbi:MAG: UvrD-helicase domain-containing protein [Microgenomates group bacterium]|nr:UvrD-helicase domain-containing protein [Microgenomates group bacterium]
MILNDDQKKAIEYNQGPLLIIAGAGTGKTTVIVEKIKYLIKKKLAKPEEILALTFTEKAASEMEERVDQAIPYGYFQMSIATFHSFADQILREEANHIGLSTDYKLLNEAENLIFLRDNLFLFNLRYFRPLGNPNKFLEGLIQHFSRLKDEDIDPQQYLAWVKSKIKNKEFNLEEKEKYQELAQIYQNYQILKIKKNYLDFSDLIFYLLKLFRTRKNLLLKYQKRFKYVLIDEFQDTNIAQYLLIRILCPAKKNPYLTVVGDDSQAIYKFRGASVSNILSFRKDYPQAKQITLIKNYRSNQNILDVAYRLIKNNDPDTLEVKLGISKKLIAFGSEKTSDNQTVDFYLAERVENEAEFVSKKIIELHKNYRYSDFAILVRANNHTNAFIKSLARRGIPYQFLGPGMLFKQGEIKDLIAYLNFLADPNDTVSFYRVLSMDILKIDSKDISLLLSFAKKTNLSLFQAVEIYLSFFFPKIYQKEFAIYKQYLPLINENSRQSLFRIYQMVNRHLNLVKKETAGQILYYFLEDSGYLNKLVSYNTEKEEKIALNISKFFDLLKNYETEHEDASVQAVTDFIKISLELKESPLVAETDLIKYDAVNILTVHSAKGLEFPVVFLVNLSEQRFPTRERRETIPIPDELIKEILPTGNYHLQEERRLFYVGLTRAQEKLFLSASLYYGEGKRIRKISPFVYESLGEKAVFAEKDKREEEKKQLSIFEFKKSPEIITKVNHLPSNFSYSQLETFLACPLQYKYLYILKIPTSPSAATSFGTTIHNALKKFYQWFLKEGRRRTKKEKLNQLLNFFDDSWIPLGYASVDHQKRMKIEGKTMLTNFFKKFHHDEVQIIGLEKPFRLKIDRDIFISGYIDRIDLLKDKIIEIIDYKTGRMPSKKELEQSLQLSIYALAGKDKNFIGRSVKEINLVFYFLQNQTKFSLKRSQQELTELKEKIISIVAEIRKSHFAPNVSLKCDFCPFRMICEAWQ